MSEFRLNHTIIGLLRNPECPGWMLRDAVLDSTGYDMAQVYVVYGQTGEYSDHSDWSVAAFLDEEQATAFCEKCNQWCKAKKCHSDEGRELGRDVEKEHGPHPHDQNFHCDYTGTDYFVAAVPLRAE